MVSTRSVAVVPSRNAPECLAPYGRRQTLRAAIGRHQHAILRRECAAASGQAIGIEVHGPGTGNHHGAQRIRGAAASARHQEHRAVYKPLTQLGDPRLPLLFAQFFGPAARGVSVARRSHRRARDRLHPEMLLEPLYQCSKGSLGIGALESVSRAPDWNE